MEGGSYPTAANARHPRRWQLQSESPRWPFCTCVPLASGIALRPVPAVWAANSSLVMTLGW